MTKGGYALALTVGLAWGCSGDAPSCVSDADCTGGLVCVAARCRAAVSGDAGAAGSDAGTTDAGATDAGATDAGGSDDAGLHDAGSSGCTLGASGCPDGTECRATDPADACVAGRPGTCLVLGPDDGTPRPECGCDGWSYASGASRREAGVEHRHDGFCTCDECASGGTCDRGSGCGGPEPEGVCVLGPTACADAPGEPGWGCGETSADPTYPNECARLLAHAERVDRTPSSCPGPAARAGCCFLDTDCATRGETCYGTTGCAASQEGVCLPAPDPDTGNCYGARDCPPGFECTGSTVVPCEPTLSALGRCVLRLEGLR